MKALAEDQHGKALGALPLLCDFEHVADEIACVAYGKTAERGREFRLRSLPAS